MDLISLEMIYFRLKYEWRYLFMNMCVNSQFGRHFSEKYGAYETIYVIIKIKANLTWERWRSEQSSHFLFSKKITFKQIFKQKLWYFIACCLDVKCLLMQTDGRSISWVRALISGIAWAVVIKFIVFQLNSKRLHFKGAFFSESEIRFSNLQNKLLQITILNLKFEIPAHNSKQLIQISNLG